ncbi:hypothetical protein JOD64_002491 [Micromonospora luteifusca]|uniref:Uncharacterized protein n=1 Tax=Micromonospora luteifusca TaxID=709860 RepID=A0ABS2LUG9_9ACTN|nr:hypothetical protein [Micromonospora luteifusca]
MLAHPRYEVGKGLSVDQVRKILAAPPGLVLPTLLPSG